MAMDSDSSEACCNSGKLWNDRAEQRFCQCTYIKQFLPEKAHGETTSIIAGKFVYSFSFDKERVLEEYETQEKAECGMFNLLVVHGKNAGRQFYTRPKSKRKELLKQYFLSNVCFVTQFHQSDLVKFFCLFVLLL